MLMLSPECTCLGCRHTRDISGLEIKVDPTGKEEGHLYNGKRGSQEKSWVIGFLLSPNQGQVPFREDRFWPLVPVQVRLSDVVVPSGSKWMGFSAVFTMFPMPATWGEGSCVCGACTHLSDHFLLSPPVEQVANVVLYSSDFYTKVVAAEEAQWVNVPVPSHPFGYPCHQKGFSNLNSSIILWFWPTFLP